MRAGVDALADHWFPVARAGAIRDKPLRVVVFGTPLVVVRGSNGQPWVFEDRCPHRGAALSRGRLTSSGLTCPYHGWSFGADGRCTEMPGYTKIEAIDAVRLERFATHERDGLVWISCGGDNPLPERIQALDASNRRFLWQSRWAASVIDVQENFLDALHTHFVHPGLVRRADRRKPVNVTLRTGGDGFHVDYTGQPDQSGLIYKLFESRRTRERAYLSGLSTAQIEYQYASNRTVWITLCCTPMATDSTHIFGMLHLDGQWTPSWLIKLLVWPYIRRVARQDQEMVDTNSGSAKRLQLNGT
jgi:phenylpropionate dioxygenase-like ring-hydroxylating dioxygenase large terminal subunit